MTASNILIITEGQLGDLLLLTPSIRALRTSHPSATISVLIAERRSSGAEPPRNEHPVQVAEQTALSFSPHINQVFSIRRDRLRQLSLIKRFQAELAVVKFIRTQQFDAVISMFPEGRFALWAFLSGAGLRIGEPPRGYRWAFTHVPGKRKGDRSIAEYFADLVRLMGVQIDSLETEFVSSGAANEWAENFLHRHSLQKKRFILIHPGATGDYKIWPPERFSRMIILLEENTGLPVVLCGARQDGPVLSEIMKGMEKESITLETGDSIDRFGAVVARSGLCISNDSGPRHLAVAVGAPSLALFRHHHEKEWGVYQESEKICALKGEGSCALCPKGVCRDKVSPPNRYGAVCLRLISVETAVKKAIEMLKHDGGR